MKASDKMTVKQVKNQIEFHVDALFQKGYELGWNSVIEELEQLADREWNLNNRTSSEVIRKAIVKVKGEDWNDVA